MTIDPNICSTDRRPGLAVQHTTTAMLLAACTLLVLLTTRASAQDPTGRHAFVPNLGQWDARSSYTARFGAITTFLEPQGWKLAIVQPQGPALDPAWAGSRRQRNVDSLPQLDGVALRMRFLGAEPRPSQVPGARLPGYHNYLLGNDQGRWRSDVPLFAAVDYKGMYPGVDIRVRNAEGTMEYDLLLAPGADLQQVQVVVEGGQGLRLSADGSLWVDTALGPIRQPPPISWQVTRDGREEKVQCRYLLLGKDRFGFITDDRDPDLALIVDPKIVFSTLLGGSDFEYAGDLELDPTGRILVCGYTLSVDYPTTTGTFQPTHQGGPWDGFLTMLNASGTALVFSTFVGGDNQESVQKVKVESNGLLHLTGGTWSSNFPTTPGAYDTSHNGSRDVFYLRLTPDGRTLIYGTLLGSPNNDAAFDMAVDATGVVTLCGQAGDGFPTTANAYSVAFAGGMVDGFIARLDPSRTVSSAQLTYSTLLGGQGDDYCFRLVQATDGSLYLAGSSNSPDFPTTAGVIQPNFGGTWDATVCHFDWRLSGNAQLRWSTYLGGAISDYSWQIAVTVDGVTVAGETQGGGFPTTPGAVSEQFNGGGGTGDGFISRMTLDGSTLLWSTYLGAQANDEVLDMVVESSGDVTVVGWTQQHGALRTTPDAVKRLREANEGFVATIDRHGSRLLYSSYFGGSGHDGAWFMAGGEPGTVTFTGATTNATFPTTPGAYQSTYGGGGYDTFITRLQTIPAGVLRYGTVSPDCFGNKPTVHALDDATAGSTTFGFACSQARPSTTALLLLSTQRSAGLPVLGIQTYVDLTAMALPPLVVATNSAGEVLLPIPIPAASTARFMVQFVVFDQAGCPTRPFSASDAIEVSW